jgi:hypothetical protein
MEISPAWAALSTPCAPDRGDFHGCRSAARSARRAGAWRAAGFRTGALPGAGPVRPGARIGPRGAARVPAGREAMRPPVYRDTLAPARSPTDSGAQHPGDPQASRPIERSSCRSSFRYNRATTAEFQLGCTFFDFYKMNSAGPGLARLRIVCAWNRDLLLSYFGPAARIRGIRPRLSEGAPSKKAACAACPYAS